MAKLTYEDKKEIIRLHLEEHIGYIELARRFNVSKKVTQMLVEKYKVHGEEVLIKQGKRKFSAEKKLEIITRVINGESKNSLAIEYNIQRSNISSWLKKYEELGYDGLKEKSKGRPQSMKKKEKQIDLNDKDAIIKSQEDRILELEAELEALKKLKALVLQRNKQQTNKKQW